MHNMRNRKTIAAAAVAAAFLSVPTIALAQSSVTVSGRLTMTFDNVEIKGRPGRNDETAVGDNTSFIRFAVVEDLGGGLQAIGQVETRNPLDTGAISAAGTNFIGLRSKNWGTVRIGRENLHYFHRESDMFAKGGSLRGDSIGILGYAGGGGVSIANATRTPNTVVWVSPNWSGFTLNAAYSSNPGTTGTGEADIGSTTRKGRAWNLNPNYKASNWQIGASFWDAKADGVFVPAAAAAGGGFGAPAQTGGSTFGTAPGVNQKSSRFYGSYAWSSGFKLGFAYDDSELETVTAAATTKVSDRKAWSIPLSYTTGPHSFFVEYSEADRDKVIAGDTKADLISLTYVYSLSKRTAIGVNYARLDNGAAAFYNLYTSRNGLYSPTGVGSTGANPNAGEDARVIGISVSHYF